MKNYYSIYRKPTDWAVLDSKIIHDFSKDENPIEAVYVLIGTLHYKTKDYANCLYEKRTPITRWMTRKEYENYAKV